MDKVTQHLLDSFIKKHALENKKQSEVFEDFCNYIVMKNECNIDLDFASNDISTGGSDDTGIDGLGIIVNGKLMNYLMGNENAIDEYLKNQGKLNIEFIFIQSKKSPKFESSVIRTVYNGVSNFFKKTSMPANDSITELSKLKDKLFADRSKYDKKKIKIKVFYVTTGKAPEGNDHIDSAIDIGKKQLHKLSISECIKTKLFGIDEIKKICRKIELKNATKFMFENRVDLPQIKDVENAHYGIIPFKEFKKVLIEDGEMRNLFYDNVRDNQGNKNKVNKQILETLESETPDLFSVLNNGVTIIANFGDFIGDEANIEDYQIVNGCQTSYVLFQNKDNKSLDEVQIPLRLIITKDKTVRDDIILSTNNQTTVRNAQLSAMSLFQKGLEVYYQARFKDGELYYERRSKQYASDETIKNNQIISIENQAKSFSSMFRQDPHLATTYFGKLANAMNKSDSDSDLSLDLGLGLGLCDDNHQYVPYYMAGLAYSKLEVLFGNKTIDKSIDKKLKRVRFYVLMLVLMIVTGEKEPKLNIKNSSKTEKFCEPIIEKLLDEEDCLKIFKKAAEIIERSIDIKDTAKIKDAVKSKELGDTIKNKFNPTTDHI